MPRGRYSGSPADVPLRQLPAAALRASLAEGYGAASFRADAPGRDDNRRVLRIFNPGPPAMTAPKVLISDALSPAAALLE